MVNLGTKAVLIPAVSTAAVGAGLYGGKRMGWIDDEWERRNRERLDQLSKKGDDAKAVVFGLFRTSACATAAGWFQVYSGGIVIDTVATRLQSGKTLNQALWGLQREAPAATVVGRFARLSTHKSRGIPGLAMTPRQVYGGMILRSNLTAGHFVTMVSRFPYLMLNFTAYQQTEGLIRSFRPPERRSASNSVLEEMACVSASTVVSTTAITVAECPKILDQVSSKCGQARTVMSVYKEMGLKRLFQGYSACFCREYLFNVALLGSPGLAKTIHDMNVEGKLGETFGKVVEGQEIVVASIALGLPMGFLTNVPDQLKTNIQTGQFLNMREAWAWQSAHGGGIRGLFGVAAIWRGGFIMHAVVAFNFARDRVERWI